MIAGLLQSEAVKGMSGLPGISKAPVLGDLLSSDSFRRAETELIVIVTPYLVEPYADRAKVERVSVKKSVLDNPLAQAFAANIRRKYGMKNEKVLEPQGSFGYLID